MEKSGKSAWVFLTSQRMLKDFSYLCIHWWSLMSAAVHPYKSYSARPLLCSRLLIQGSACIFSLIPLNNSEKDTCCCFSSQKTEAQRGSMICPRSHSSLNAIIKIWTQVCVTSKPVLFTTAFKIIKCWSGHWPLKKQSPEGWDLFITVFLIPHLTPPDFLKWDTIPPALLLPPLPLSRFLPSSSSRRPSLTPSSLRFQW